MTDETTQAPTVVQTRTITRTRSTRGRRVMVVVLIFLLFLLLIAGYFLMKLVRPAGDIATGDSAAGIEWVRSIYGWGPTAAEQLNRPGTVGIAPDGTIIVPDMKTNTEVIRFNPDASYAGSFHGSDDDRILFPTAIDFGSDGSMYIVQTTHDNLLKVSPDGRETIFKLGVDDPASVAVTDDRIVIGAREGFAILDSEGRQLNVIGSLGAGDDQFDNVGGIAVDSRNNIYVTDMFNNRISKYDAAGKRLWMVKTGNSANAQKNEGAHTLSVETTAQAAMQTPGPAVLDGNGRLVVLDMLDFTLAVFDPDNGKFIGKYGAYGAAEGQFQYPSGLAYDPERDWFAVADQGNNRVQLIRIPGSSNDGAMAGARRALAGPLRVLIIPLLLLLIALVYWVYSRVRESQRRKREAELAAA